MPQWISLKCNGFFAVKDFRIKVEWKKNLVCTMLWPYLSSKAIRCLSQHPFVSIVVKTSSHESQGRWYQTLIGNTAYKHYKYSDKAASKK